jgi:hypothetical protein
MLKDFSLKKNVKDGRWGCVFGFYFPRVGPKGPALLRLLIIKKMLKIYLSFDVDPLGVRQHSDDIHMRFCMT